MSPSHALPTGVGVALVTTFQADGSVDVPATVDHAVACVERGATSVLIAGTTGEPWRLSAHNRIEIAVAVRRSLPSVPLIVGTGDRSATTALDITREIVSAAVADAVLVLSPADRPCSEFYREVADIAGSVPVIGYHLPALSPPGIAVDEITTLPVAAVKDSSGDADRLARLTLERVTTYVGSPNLLVLAGSTGTHGALVGLANTMPETCIAAWNGDMRAQQRLFAAHRDSLIDFPSRLRR